MCSLCGCNCSTEHKIITFDLEVDVCNDCLDDIEIVQEICSDAMDIAV